jgi:hypothetical protein
MNSAYKQSEKKVESHRPLENVLKNPEVTSNEVRDGFCSCHTKRARERAIYAQ